jgi:zinc transport system permease protein
MALIAILVGALAGGFGLLGSITWDTPAGPSIVLAALALLLISLAVRPILSGRG